MALVPCDNCGGSGVVDDNNGQPDAICPKCSGRRQIDSSRAG